MTVRISTFVSVGRGCLLLDLTSRVLVTFITGCRIQHFGMPGTGQHLFPRARFGSDSEIASVFQRFAHQPTSSVVLSDMHSPLVTTLNADPVWFARMPSCHVDDLSMMLASLFALLLSASAASNPRHASRKRWR